MVATGEAPLRQQQHLWALAKVASNSMNLIFIDF
jgi:hypothetical protein